MCSACGYEHGPYASCHEVQARNWRADWLAEARMYEAQPPTPVEPESGDRVTEENVADAIERGEHRREETK